MHTPSLPTTSLPAFAHLTSIHLNGLTTAPVNGAGVGLQHTRARYDAARPLLTIDHDLVVCAATVESQAKADAQLAEVLRAVGDFALTPRGAIMVFLVVAMSTAAGLEVGRRGNWSEYVKFLPSRVSVPTTWTDAERKLLEGTSLQVAVKAKLQSLAEEFEYFRSSTSHIPWCARAWWQEAAEEETEEESEEESAEEALTLSDWTHLDSLFRSRVLQFPRLGIGMAPVLDFANHADNANAYYSVDADRNVVLFPRAENCTSLQEGEEVTINYGAEKSAAELVFTYGFLPASQRATLWLALDLRCPPDDPLARAKEAVAHSAPMLRVIDLGGEILWTGSFVWLMCVNEEDGLSFRVLQRTDGTRSLQVLWCGEEVEDIAGLEGRLEESGLWEVYQLRALMLVQERVRVQLGELVAVEEELARVEETEETEKEEEEEDEDGGVREVAGRLRQLERRLMEKVVESLEDQKEKLLGTAVVREYLRTAGMDDNSGDGGDDEDEEGGIEVKAKGDGVEDGGEDLS